MKICKIYIKGFQQFQDVELDFTNPETGEPVEKVCFIGSNGTGKTKLLLLINSLVNKCLVNYHIHNEQSLIFDEDGVKVLFYLRFSGKTYFIFLTENVHFIINGQNDKLKDEQLASKILSKANAEVLNEDKYWIGQRTGTQAGEFLDKLRFKNRRGDLLIYSPAETEHLLFSGPTDVPKSSPKKAAELKHNFPFYNKIIPETVSNFWKVLIYNVKERDERRRLFENEPANLQKTKRELVEEFDRANPDILKDLIGLWNKILEKAHLEVAEDDLKSPIQLDDNLEIYIRHRHSKKVIPYYLLSTGIKNFMFRIGHIFSLYYDRQIDKGILLVDEPENSFYPDYLLELLDTYSNVIIDKRGQNNTQMFFATHSPIIAAQFQPYERIVLEWNEDGSVRAQKGISPIGDDPNDILVNDFGSGYTNKFGIEQWNRYLEMKRKLADASDKEERKQLIGEISRIGQLYNYPE